MKDKKNKKYVIVSQKLYPSQISELSMCCFIVKNDKLDDLLSFIVNNGGRVVSATMCSGISRSILLNSINGNSNDSHFVLAMCQKEITDIFMINICREFNINSKGNGKAFVLDILGYMGAKGPFVE